MEGLTTLYLLDWLSRQQFFAEHILFLSANTDQIILADRIYFMLIDVPGNGNCLYHSLIQSNKFCTSNHRLLRTDIFNKAKALLLQNDDITVHLQQLYRSLTDYESTSFAEHCEIQKENGRWGKELDMVLITLFHKVRVVSYSNLTSGIRKFDSIIYLGQTLKWSPKVLQKMGINSVETI